MDQYTPEIDPIYLKVEQMSRDFALFPPTDRKTLHRQVKGLLPPAVINASLEKMKQLDLEEYIARTVQPASEPSRPGADAVIRRLGGHILRSIHMGPMVVTEMELDFDSRTRRVGIIAQERTTANGVWLPEHHEAAACHAREFANLGIPIITMIDTPGADAGETANLNNQAHCISRLIAEMAGIDVPTLAIILGNGYSGGAIPLGAANLLFSVRDGVFNTIHPMGLASIARKLNLSWQECARFVKVSAMELYDQGIIDGIVDYVPGEDKFAMENLRNAITGAIAVIESSGMDFVSRTPEIFEHYRRSVLRMVSPSPRLRALQRQSAFQVAPGPGEHQNVFGAAFRYLRYLSLRNRLRSSTVEQYGRLAVAGAAPVGGDLQSHQDQQQRRAFSDWLQDPDPAAYDDRILRALKSYRYWRDTMSRQRGRLHSLLLGEAGPNLEWSREFLCMQTGFFLYNRWKTDANANFRLLLNSLDSPETPWLFRIDSIVDPPALAATILHEPHRGARRIKDRLSPEALRIFNLATDDPESRRQLGRVITTEFNRILDDPHLGIGLSGKPEAEKETLHESNRRQLESYFPALIKPAPDSPESVPPEEATLLDMILDPKLRANFVREIHNLLAFDLIYDQLVAQLPRIAGEAIHNWTLSKDTVREILDQAIEYAVTSIRSRDPELFRDMEHDGELQPRILAWLRRLSDYPRRSQFLVHLEEWKNNAFPRMSDTLFVVITDFFCRLMPQLFRTGNQRGAFNGRLNPRRIGRKKDFWNRLSTAYRDLLIGEILMEIKNRGRIPAQKVIDSFFTDFEEMDANVMTADPLHFPGFRRSIEKALNSGTPPCGALTGVANFSSSGIRQRVGVIVSNPEFQAGAFDMASAEKMCRLLTRCARLRLPVVGFVSSGGMQTKEGAGGLFPMAVVNALINRFVRDHDLPVIMFGFGDCTGGAQASFVTHPLVHTWYFSGANIPFAGQIVVPAHLPAHSTLSNYLSEIPNAMSGLVVNQFVPDLDERLVKVDPEIPLPRVTVDRVLTDIFRDVETRSDSLPLTRLVPAKPVYRSINRVLLHARGCTAVRLIDLAHKRKCRVILVQSDPDMDSLPAGMLTSRDRLVCIGGNTADESYLNAHSIIKVAHMEAADALHPGIGFLSENPDFAKLCLEHGLNFIGPPITSMESMGNKSNAIQTAIKNQVPVVPGSHGILADSVQASRIADEIGYPVVLKAVHGGGGKGIRVVHKPDDIHQAFLQISTEARNAFGNGDVYLEKYITRLRHVEVQVLRDLTGHIVIPGIRDCSVQRNNQKLIEESASTLLSKELEKSVLDSATRLCNAIDYVGAGTVEFILDLDGPAVYFMEMNTRLQVEHPVSEVVSGIDIVDAQFRVAQGESLKDLKIRKGGYAMEVRINAERPLLDSDGGLSFVPAPGTVTACEFPEDPGVRVIAAVSEGRAISPYYDSLITQAIVSGRDRRQAIRRMSAWLEKVDIQGVPTNIPLLRRILADDNFLKGDFTTAFLETFTARIDAQGLIRETEAAAAMDSVDHNAVRISDSADLKVLSPSTGIFYLTPSPTEPEFVRVGDIVDVNRTLCLLEAMKMFTQVTLEGLNSGSAALYPPASSYQVMRINVSAGEQVNEGDLLFVIRPITE